MGIVIGSFFSNEIQGFLELREAEMPTSKVSSNVIDNPQKLSKMIVKDFEILDLQSELPADWQNLKEIKYLPTSPKAEEYLKESQPELITSPSGKYQLELIYIDFQDEEATGFMIQSSLIDLKSKNKIWEIVRSFNLPEK
jgi:hypothetical protein